jgi:hypothetical protein
MGITTRFNALHQLLERLRSSGGSRGGRDQTGPEDLAEVLDGFSGRALTSADAARLATALSAYKEGLPARVRSLRALFQESQPSDAEQLDFHTAYELLYRFVDDLHSYAQTHASLADHRHERERWDEPFTPQTNWLGRGLGDPRLVHPDGAGQLLGGHRVAERRDHDLDRRRHRRPVRRHTEPETHGVPMACGTFLGALIGFVEMFSCSRGSTVFRCCA